MTWLEDHPDFQTDPFSKDSIISDGLKIASGHSNHSPDLDLVEGVEMPPKIKELFKGSARYRCAHGGRGSGKSFNFALRLAVLGYLRKHKILCTREIQRTIDQSVMAQIMAAIENHPFLANFYEVGRSFIRGKNGTEFIFMGLRHNPEQIKSTHGVTICWVEEAEGVSAQSWNILTPTIREANSEIWVTWNPESSDSETYKRFIDNPPASAKVIEVNWSDNPWFPEVLENERQESMNGDPEVYQHVWEGKTITRTEAQIFGGKYEIRDFTPQKNWNGAYFGLDFGFSNDPTAGVKCWIGDGCLWIEYEAGGRKLELDNTAKLLIDQLPEIEKHTVRADNARPESISHLKRKGLPLITACKKGQGSVQDGIDFIRNFDKIIIHSRCVEMTKEARLYSYKTDRLTGDVLPIIIDAHNHYWDAVRYAIEPAIRNKSRNYGKIL